MKRRMHFVAVVLLVLGAIPALGATKGSINPSHLRTEYAIEPLGVEVAQPQFTYLLNAVAKSARGVKQTAYQIQVASSPVTLQKATGDVWDSGLVRSDETAHIRYAGKPLQSKTDYWWHVKVWDASDMASDWSEPAHFAMGLLSPQDWKASWIEAPGAFVKDNNGYRSELTKDAGAQKWMMIDLACRPKIDTVALYPAKPFDLSPTVAGYLFPKRFRIDVSDSPDFKAFKTVVDRTAEDVPNPGEKPLELSFSPVAGRYVRLFVTKLADDGAGQYGVALAELSVRGGGLPLSLAAARAHASDSFEQGGWALTNLNDADMVSHRDRGGPPLPPSMFRKSFSAVSTARRARIFVTALGSYEIWVNGKRVGENVLAPESTDYSKRVQYQVFDVTDQIRSGENVLGAVLGDGWYAGRPTYAPGRRPFGTKPRLLVQLELESADGTRTVIVSDSSWKVTEDGPIRSSDHFDGEVYDERKEMPGWNGVGFDEHQWKQATVVPAPSIRIVSQTSEPIKVTQDVQPISITEPSPGVYLVDMGQNIVGWVRARLRGPAGTIVKLRHAEMLKPDGTPYFENVWHSILGAEATETYTLAGRSSASVFEPHFTYHGFRYVQVTGLDYRPALSDFTGRVVHSSAPRTGRFESSDQLLNKIADMAWWSQRGNMMSIPTDCPQRSERLGWMGDAQVFSQAAIFNMEMARFFEKWLSDIRDLQTPEGAYSSVAPSPVPSFPLWPNSPGWADAGVIVPWNVYVSYGDKRVLEEHYDSAKRFVDSVRRANPDLIWHARTFGDWLNADTLNLGADWPKSGAATPTDLFATAFFAHSTDLLSKMAKALGRDQDAAEYQDLAKRIGQAFVAKFISTDGRMLGGPDEPDAEFQDRQGVAISGDTQAAYGLALEFGMIPEQQRKQAVDRLVSNIQKYNWHLSTGIQGTNPVMLSLADNGRVDVAYRLLQTRTVPSWGYMIDQGATTIWERWDGYVAGRGFQNSGMNSMNHYALGAVSEWLYRNVAGINPDPQEPGYRHFVVRPRPGGDLSWARGTYESIRGNIESSWKLHGNVFELNVTVPVNTTATVYVPAKDANSITEGGAAISKQAGIKFAGMQNGAAVFEVKSGNYSFRSPVAEQGR